MFCCPGASKQGFDLTGPDMTYHNITPVINNITPVINNITPVISNITPVISNITPVINVRPGQLCALG